MVIARVFGGLGNQLFIYATAKRLAVKNNIPLKLDIISGFKRDYEFKREYLLDRFNIQAEIASRAETLSFPGGRFLRFSLKRISRLQPFEKRFYITEKSGNFNPGLMDIRVKKSLVLEGYWQSEKYFKDIEEIIRKEFIIKESLKTHTRTEEELLKSRAIPVCIGFRFYQEANSYTYNMLGDDYYKKAIEILTSRVKNPHFFIFCNDNELVERSLLANYPHTYITAKPENQGAVQDLYLMRQCKHFIIPNSTFHWWGAWLAGNANKIVIAPENKFNNKDTIPADWLKI